MFLLCSNARSLHIKASNCWVTLFTFAKSFEYMTAFCAFFTVCVRTPYNDWGGGEAGGWGSTGRTKNTIVNRAFNRCFVAKDIYR